MYNELVYEKWGEVRREREGWARLDQSEGRNWAEAIP